MLPGAISRADGRWGLPYSRRAIRWAAPLNVYSRVQAELASFLGALGLVVIAAFAISAAKVTIRLQVQDLQFRVSASRALQAKLLAERDLLNQRVAELSNAAEIESRAFSKLAMVRPLPGQELMVP